MAYAPAYPHDPIEPIAEDVFMVRGSTRMNALLRISRNMAIIRHRGELTLVNPIRLDAAGETQLRGLGEVKRMVRLGSLHGVDDPYYADSFHADLWSQPGGTTYTQPAIACELSESTELPFPGADLFCFRGTKQPESALLLKRSGGILLTCDAIQHYGDYRHNNLPARLAMPFIGFPKTTIIGPIWLKMMTPQGGLLQREFERLLGWEFDSLLSAHGSYLRSGAHAAVAAALRRSFPR
ncbi:MAG TPA: hypothetical protein VMW56_20465 [Candidatus Margulisiibacteriota bacterium]|nr:hypothetical protein [Candidatus Margulisiibacteriota bacterium]